MFSKKIQLLLLMSLTTYVTGSLADEMIRNGSFSNGIDGWWTAGGNIKTTDKQACMEIVNPGENSWSVILGHGGIGLEQGESYQIRFDAYANTDTKVKTLIQHEGPPYTNHFVTDTDISTTKKSYHYTFLQEQASDAGAEFQFQMGGSKTSKYLYQ